jgi:hypothetical protein
MCWRSHGRLLESFGRLKQAMVRLTMIDSQRPKSFHGFRKLRPLKALVLSLSLAAFSPPASAQLFPFLFPSSPNRQGATNPEPRPNPHEPPAPHFSKFEARRIRHTCAGHANERGLKGAERSAYLTHCYFGRVSHRGLRLACHKEAAAKGLDKNAQRDFVRECVKERAKD